MSSSQLSERGVGLLSTLGFTEEDVAYFASLEGVAGAEGSVARRQLQAVDPLGQGVGLQDLIPSVQIRQKVGVHRTRSTR